MQHTRLDPEKSGHSEEANVSKKRRAGARKREWKREKKLAAKRYLFDAELTIESAKFNVLLMFILLN